jgi:hypothetical protein
MTGHKFGSHLVINPEEPLTLEATVAKVLAEFGLIDAFNARSIFQQAGYMSRIARAGDIAMREERIAEMLDDLASHRDEKISSRDVDLTPPRSTYRQEG